METADVIVIGSGQGGVPLAADFAKEGRNVIFLGSNLIARNQTGGDTTC